MLFFYNGLRGSIQGSKCDLTSVVSEFVTSHQQLRLYGDGALAKSLFRQT